ncbi:flagellar basal body rod protein FlgC [uncultured Devosia sp.]|uniref:flagellar basal body rod protein FlgC n=1 Tax=uncultured Devosia sp. TaxID=211434 RepID=UPI0035C98E4B
MVDFNASMRIAATGLHAQTARMRVIAENLANADSAGKTPGEEPYRRRVPTFETKFDPDVGGKVVEVGRLGYDMSPFQSRYEPGHPAADAKGYVQYPNVNSLIETMDMREAQRTYEANLNVVTVTRQMLGRTLDILRG